MNLWNLLLENNASLLIFSATGFIISLIWYVISEKSRRSHAESKLQLTDEASFFGQFEDLENPALKIPDFTTPVRSSLPNSVRGDGPVFARKLSIENKEDAKVEKPSEGLEFFKKSLLQDLEESQSDDSGEVAEAEELEVEAEEESSEPEFSGKALREEAMKFGPSVISDEENDESASVTEAKQNDDESDHANDSSDSDELQAGALDSETSYDEDEQKVKELLEQIKKDMREQGEHTS